MDDDLEQLARDQLISEIKKLRAGIRRHRDSTGHALCWHHPELWQLLPEKVQPDVAVPEWPHSSAVVCAIANLSMRNCQGSLTNLTANSTNS